jgi:5-methylcytosine-specific restriction endonuclease McrA
MSRVLLLNSAWVPHKVIAWSHAITMIYTDKVEVVQTTDEVIYTSSTGEVVRMPSVVRLVRPIEGMKRAVKFSRVNVFTRDGFKCCYCGSQKRMGELNYDHVLPRRLGGRTVWDNIVTACYPCNGRKADRTPEQAGMKLLRRPYKPKTLPITVPRFDPRDIPEEWVDWVRAYFVDQATG